MTRTAKSSILAVYEDARPLRFRGRRGRASPGPNPIDVHVGKRLRERRTILGLSQQELAKRIGITFQQLQKNERGPNRLAASRIFRCGHVLGVGVDWFFSDMAAEISRHGRAHLQGVAKGPAPTIELDPMARRETIEAVRAYYDIRNEQMRAHIVTTMLTLGAAKGASAANAKRRGRPPKGVGSDAR
ncbi:MAG: helix-turn-helix transcriptional regulator [Alphaproteobacteria bacterium]|nr:helix-turn-helix transcriptional regulator [Alphaproteobacteria bacterium]